MTTKKTLYIHIGQHKTGTSTIQNFFWKNRKQVEAAGVLYPDVGLSGPTHANLALSLPGRRDQVLEEMFKKSASDRNGTYHPYSGTAARDLYAELGRQIASTSCPVVFLSSECFMEWIKPDLIRVLLREYCDCDVKVLLTLRRQDLWIQSVFNQVVKDPGLRFSGALDDMPQMAMLDYHHMVQEWSDAFGPGNMIVVPYETAFSFESGVVGLVADIIEMDLSCDYQTPSYQEQNVSLSGKQLSVLHELNRRNISCERFQRILNSFTRRNEREQKNVDSADTWLGFEQAQSLYARYREGNRKIAQSFLGMDSLFPEPTVSEYRRQLSLRAEEIVGLVEDVLAITP